MKELWRPIPQYEQWYEVSNLGRIKVLAYDTVANSTELLAQFTESKKY